MPKPTYEAAAFFISTQKPGTIYRTTDRYEGIAKIRMLFGVPTTGYPQGRAAPYGLAYCFATQAAAEVFQAALLAEPSFFDRGACIALRTEPMY